MNREVKKSKSLYQRKIEDLYHFYMSFGFEHSVDTISAHLNISRKTFFNRYISKDNSVRLTFDLWMRHLKERILDRLADCNNSVESLVIFILEMNQIAREEVFYYQFAEQHNLMMDPKAPFGKIIIQILHEGQQHYQVAEELSLSAYVHFFLFNVFHYFSNREMVGEEIRFLLAPALNERGVELMNFVIGSMENE